ncbi:Uncharacterised protein [Vibrio cholerae]|nr:Uncharacterised protein [Vibrio cholerae]
MTKLVCVITSRVTGATPYLTALRNKLSTQVPSQ